jgi:G-rich domain on putative tyrosine kinase
MFSRTVFFSVFLLVAITATIVTFILPQYYAGTARVHVNGDPAAALEAIRSEAVLAQVVEKLNLNGEWGRKFNNGVPLKTDDSVRWLKTRAAIHPGGDGSLIDVTFYSEDSGEAARIANAVAETCQAQQPSGQVEIVDPAKPAHVPAKPNKNLNIAIGIVAGLVLGAVMGWLVGMLNRNRR